MYETSKLNNYRLARNYQKYFRGLGIDVGCGNDPLNAQVFGSNAVVSYDTKEGDGQTCFNIPDESFDFVYSSHFLEHTQDPALALQNWIRICRPNGYIVFAVPHEIYYEKNMWPSRFNSDHKWSFRMEPVTSLPRSINIYDLLATDIIKSHTEIISVELILNNYDFTNFSADQTLGNASCQIEAILHKNK